MSMIETNKLNESHPSSDEIFKKSLLDEFLREKQPRLF